MDHVYRHGLIPRVHLQKQIVCVADAHVAEHQSVVGVHPDLLAGQDFARHLGFRVGIGEAEGEDGICRQGFFFINAGVITDGDLYLPDLGDVHEGVAGDLAVLGDLRHDIVGQRLGDHSVGRRGRQGICGIQIAQRALIGGKTASENEESDQYIQNGNYDNFGNAPGLIHTYLRQIKEKTIPNYSKSRA